MTYGQEIKTSVEYANKQQKYLDQNNFVDPEDAPSSSRTTVYNFDSRFLPYVRYSTATVQSGENATRELKVNVHISGLEEGCGTYNHPYEITTGTQLVNIAASMSKETGGYLSSLRLPKIDCKSDANLTTLYSDKKHWCENKTYCAVFTHDESTSTYNYKEGNKTYTWNDAQVSLYLASAYYVIKQDIIIDSASFKGLGASPTNDTTGKYAFRGVIVGANEAGTVTITNKSGRFQPTANDDDRWNTMGLISMSNGCVVKNLTIEVDLPDTDLYSYRSNENKAYAYNEDFPNYGAVINKIMGGDNIIDNVSVNFVDDFKVREGNDYKATIGGYVGCVVNGGLIFRNVDDSNLTRTVVENGTSKKVKGFKVIKVNDKGVQQEVKIGSNVICSSKVDGSMTDEDDLIHIHINPFVGRVINGYAIRETDSYGFSEDGKTYGDGETRADAVEVTMHNTRKNYSIPDIDTTNTNVLSFSPSAANGTYDTITVPDSQALYIMSIIAQSGSGCASSDNGDYAYNISYCGSATRNYSGGVTDNNKATHLAAYSNVGTATSTDDSDYTLSKSDTLNNRKAVPYIIKKYTSSYTSGNTTYYPARTLTKRTFYVNLVGGTTYYLPDSFRGIGSLGSNTLDDNMKIYGFNGNGTTANPTIIDVNTEYFLNQQDVDPYYGSNIGVEYRVGIGLFNNLMQSTSAGFDSKYERESKYQITNFTLQGYLSAHHVNASGVDENAKPEGNRNGTFMDTAGFVPTVLFYDSTVYNFSNIMFKSLHINSYAYAAGFVAYTNGPKNDKDHGVMIYINNCNADGFKIEGSGRVAGFVGSYDTNRGLDSLGKDSFTSVMKNTIINNKFSRNTKHNYTAGILGSVWFAKNNNNLPSDNGDNAIGHLILRNVTIEGGNAETNYIGNKNDPSGSSGGIIGGGSSKVNGCLIQNCIVKDIDIYGNYAGGIMGEDANRNSGSSNTGARIVGCNVTGKLDENNKPQYTIMGKYYAGGVYGDTRDTNTSIHPKYKSISAGNTDYVTYKTDIDGVYVYGYNIFSANTANADTAFTTNKDELKTRVAAGGLIGSNNENRYIQNCKVEKCVIDVGTGSTANNTPCGGIVGQMNTGTLYGYNIEVKDCDFLTHQWSNGAATNIQKAYTYTDENGTHNPVSGMKCGNFIGNGNDKIVNLTAVHSENNPASDDFNNLGTSFIVYADYNDVASSDDKGTEMSTLSDLPSGYTNVGEGGLKDYFPNVNVSPVTQMGDDSFLTGDGAALYEKSITTENAQGEEVTEIVKTPVIDAIVNDSDSNYLTAPAEVIEYIQHALQSTSYPNEPNKISTYKTEMGSLPDGVDDFTVLVINSTAHALSTEFINNYIQMVTNTNNSYNVVSGIYKSINKNDTYNYQVNVYPCTYDGDKYVINAEGKTAGLYVSHSNVDNNTKFEYYMDNTHADSNQGDFQFSLMDVQFFNPNTNLKEVVYHLYIPVLTKKMLMFEFYSASLSGTDNNAANFANYGNTLAESLDSWYTAYLHFTYDQTELQSILESGAGLNWNGAKTVLFKYQNDRDNAEAKLDADTQLVLCDPNNADKYYYATLSDLRPEIDPDGQNDTISFAKFKTELGNSGSPFTAQTLNDMLLKQGFTIKAETAAVGTSGYIYAPTNDASQADVIISENEMYKKDETNGTVKLTISYPKNDGSGNNDDSKVLEENYYLAVRAKGSSVYNYSIRTPATTSGGADKPTLRRSNVEENNVTNLIMGNLYEQTVTINVKNTGTSSSEITSENHRLDVELISLINLTGNSNEKDFILGHLSSNSNIHLYQSFIINLTAKDISGERNEILGSPTATTDFTITGNNQEPLSATGVQQKDISGSFIQLEQFDIKDYLSKSGFAQIKAETQIDFAESWQYNAEFPTQDGSPNPDGSQKEIGVNVSAKSNLAYNADKLRFTNMTAEPKPPSSQYFYIKESDKAELVFNAKSEILDEYDKVGSPSFNYSQQGINPKNFIDVSQTRLPIKATATYNATKIKRSDFTEATKVKYTLKLYKKTDANGEVKYTEVNDISKYIDLNDANSVFIKVNSGVTSIYANGAKMTKNDNHLEYTADLDQSAFTSKDNQRIAADIDFTVITGTDLKDYANYRFVLEVELLKTNDGKDVPITNNSIAHDWIVYTNAKINPDMLTMSEYE